MALFDFIEHDDGGWPTEDVDCTHIQRIVARGTSGQIQQIDDQAQRKFFDHIGGRRGLRVLTHETTTDSAHGEASIVHEIVYVIESRPTKGYVKLTLKSEQSPQQAPNTADLFSGESAEAVMKMFKKSR